MYGSKLRKIRRENVQIVHDHCVSMESWTSGWNTVGRPSSTLTVKSWVNYPLNPYAMMQLLDSGRMSGKLRG